MSDSAVPPRPDSVYAVHIQYVPVDRGGPAHRVTVTCEHCGTEWTALQPKVPQRDNATNIMTNHRTECAALNPASHRPAP